MCSRQEPYTSIQGASLQYRNLLSSQCHFHYPQKAGRPSAAPKLLPGPPALQRAISAKTPKTAGAAPQLMRAVSGGSRRPQAMGFSPTLMMGSSDPRFGQTEDGDPKVLFCEQISWIMTRLSLFFLQKIILDWCVGNENVVTLINVKGMMLRT